MPPRYNVSSNSHPDMESNVAMANKYLIAICGIVALMLFTAAGANNERKEPPMVRQVKPDQRDLKPLEVPGATVEVSNPIIGVSRNLAAGFTKYVKPSDFEWMFDYDEVFYMLEGAVTVPPEGKEPIEFKTGDLGYIPKGTKARIIVPKSGYLLHITQPAWQEKVE
jgi:mannose-6-phosphate isomerase-like protein (cupin superfamily)